AAIVDFAGHAGWRRHGYLMEHYIHPCCDRREVSPEDGHPARCNHYRHFEEWRARMHANIAAKPDHRARILVALDGIESPSLATRAQALNALGLATHGGRAWTADNLRKFMKATAGQD